MIPGDARMMPELWFIVPQLLAGLCVGVLFAAIAIDFVFLNRRRDVREGRRSIVATGSMTAFFLVYYLVLSKGTSALGIESRSLALLWTGSLMVLAGAGVNIWGRVLLKRNWANHIKIYDDHTLVRSGVYRVVRHPLYASIMLMLLGGAVMYRNIICGVLTVFIFIPFMTLRAKQEEELLLKRFPDYTEYRNQTGMFVPKLWR